MPRRDTAARGRSPGRLIRCRAIELTRSLPDACIDLIYVDPPFATGSRRRAAGGGGFDDAWAGGLKGYLRFLHPHLSEFRRLLAPHGSLWVHLDWRAAAYVRLQLDTEFGAKAFINEIIWHYRTGGVSRRWFGRKHDTILGYARIPGRHRFHAQRGGTYRTDGLKVDRRGPYKQTRGGRLYFHADGPLLTDVWDIPFLSTVSKERTGWPTQKPLALVERIVRATTNTGDLVGDFFAGSGTTLVAAARLGRRFVGCDTSPRAVEIARRRLRSATKEWSADARPGGTPRAVPPCDD